MMTVFELLNALISLFVLILFAIIYFYINNLENMGCECSVHPYRDMIKQFTLFAFVFVIITMLVPKSLLTTYFGSTVGELYVLIKIFFYLVCIVYFYMILEYTRFLVNEKCKCSDDIRRELITAGSLLEIIVLLFALLVMIIIPVMVVSLDYVKHNYVKIEREMSSSMKNPFEKIRKLSSKVVSKVSSKSSRKSSK